MLIYSSFVRRLTRIAVSFRNIDTLINSLPSVRASSAALANSFPILDQNNSEAAAQLQIAVDQGHVQLHVLRSTFTRCKQCL